MHEDYLKDAIRVLLGTRHIEVYVRSPVDLIVSKMARYNGPDPEEIEARALHAMSSYVGNLDYLRMNLRDVLEKARKPRAIRQP
ncbi:DUF6036 family nucleotidyltransferase [Pseudoduganella violaceinigra]|uniref:DUF6036 family nucleotidyltransferase n=1 Tax=Pseudoduganella violaceinigra TaxID=246602 RepID=UPI0012B65D45|nr:DUF6036 family nucleotidyltransferase [Pseudoduganella violaceinigra]